MECRSSKVRVSDSTRCYLEKDSIGVDMGINDEWWEFTSSPDMILQVGREKYFIDSKNSCNFDSGLLSDITSPNDYKNTAIFPIFYRMTDESTADSVMEEWIGDKFSHPLFRERLTHSKLYRRKESTEKISASARGSPQAVLQAMDARPQPTDRDVDDLFTIIRETEKPSDYVSFLNEQ